VTAFSSVFTYAILCVYPLQLHRWFVVFLDAGHEPKLGRPILIPSFWDILFWHLTYISLACFFCRSLLDARLYLLMSTSALVGIDYLPIPQRRVPESVSPNSTVAVPAA
jgi:hypothetical protein